MVGRIGEKGASEIDPALRVRDAVQPLGDGEEGVEDEEEAGEAGEDGGHFSRDDFFSLEDCCLVGEGRGAGDGDMGRGRGG